MRAHSQRSTRVRARALSLTAATAAVLLGASAIATPAAAADTTGWWYQGMGIDDAHAAGWTGAGVKIAVIEGQINTDAPAVAGANITVHEEFACGDGVGNRTEANDDTLHGVHVVQMLAGPFGLDGEVGGIAPDAEINMYALGSQRCVDDNIVDGKTSYARALIAAVDAGNDIVSMSFGFQSIRSDYDAIAYALEHDVILVSSTPNTHDTATLNFPQGANGVVSVAAVSETLDLLVDDVDNETVITPEVTVVAPGVNIGTVGSATDWSALMTTSGSSLAAPLVAGSLALAKQKYPEATGNQLIQSLINTTASAQNGLGRDLQNGYGYGLVSLPALLSTDPQSFPDENPLMDKSGGLPAAAGATAEPSPEPSVTASEEPPSEPTPSASEPSAPPASADDSAGDSAALPWIIGGGIMVIGAGIIIFTVIRFRRTAGRS